MRDVRVQFGDFEDMFGSPGRAENFTFVPATVRLHGDHPPAAHSLQEAVGPNPPAILVEPLREGFEAAWVRGRIPLVFGFEPDAPGDESSLLYATFLAIETESPFAYPFHCTDAAGRASLIFSPAGPDVETQRRVAAAFWSVLLHKPADLADFESKRFDPKQGRWQTFACVGGDISRRDDQ